MNCYVCFHAPDGPGGTRLHIKPAIGVCHHCGVGLCDAHAVKGEDPGAPLLCPTCADFLMGDEHPNDRKREYAR